MTDTIRFRCVEVTQPIGTFYVGAISAPDVLAISYADIRRIEARDFERMVGIQRELVQKRVKELQQYVRNIDATFPASVILAIDSENAAYDPKTQTMVIKKDEKVARIIDGQHRIAGLQGFSGEFDVNVTVFIDMDLEDQAMTFAIINLQQTKVNKSLAYDLYAFQTHRSPTKTCHTIARLLNREIDSPLRERIKILGKAVQGGQGENITQATFVESLLTYVTPNAMVDRDRIRRGEEIEHFGTQETTKFLFRDLFRREKDATIAKIVWKYFDAIAEVWPTAWEATERGAVLNRSTGFRAFMKFLGVICRAFPPVEKFSKETALEVLRRIQKKLRDLDFNVDRFQPGATGEGKLFRELREFSGLE